MNNKPVKQAKTQVEHRRASRQYTWKQVRAFPVIARDAVERLLAPAGTGDATAEALAEYEAGPYVVSDSKGVPAGGTVPVLRSFGTEGEAAAYISALPEALTGRYNLDGPADDYTGEETVQ